MFAITSSVQRRRSARIRRQRRLRLETLEDRRLLSAEIGQSSFELADVNRSGEVSAFDALLVMNDLNKHGQRRLGPIEDKVGGAERAFDTNRDDHISAIDALHVINVLRRLHIDDSPPLIAAQLADSSDDNVTIVGLVSDDVTEVRSLAAQIDAGPLIDVDFDSAGAFTFHLDPATNAAAAHHRVRFIAADFRGNFATFDLEVPATVNASRVGRAAFELDPTDARFAGGQSVDLIAARQSLLAEGEAPVVNDLVKLVGLSAAHIGGIFTITATWQNRASSPRLVGTEAGLGTTPSMFAKVTELSGGNTLASADRGGTGVGAEQDLDAGTVWAPSEKTLAERFQIGLASFSPFTFFVDLWADTEVAIDINETAAENDDITLYNPAPLIQIHTQTIAARITNKGSAGTVSLAVEPAGAATIDVSTLTLAQGASQTVTITPAQTSTAANDITIKATKGGVLTGDEDMTIVTVILPQNIRRGNTPADMDDRIPPRVDTPFDIQVTPNLGTSGQVVTVTVDGQDANNGTVAINGNPTHNVTSTQSVNLRGGTQTAPTAGFSAGNAGNLELIAQVRGEDTARSAGFSVAAIPENWTISFHSKIVGARRGIIVRDRWVSDSGDIADLDSVDISEEVEVTKATGVFAGLGGVTSGYLPATVFTTDTHSTSITVIKASGGVRVAQQTSKFRDRRTGGQDIAMTNSGYRITRTVFQDPADNVWKLTTRKEGAATTAKSVASSAGAGGPMERTQSGAAMLTSLSVNNANIAEAAGTATFTATLSAADTDAVSVLLRGTATGGEDYSAPNQNLVIPAGNTTGTMTVTAVQDTLDENNETIIALGAASQATTTIIDDDHPPMVTLGVNHVNIVEAGGIATFTATLSAASALPVTVDLGFSGTATGAGTDYNASASQIVIAPGNTTGTITITAVQDMLDEDDETVIVEITGVTHGSEVGIQRTTTTITDDD